VDFADEVIADGTSFWRCPVGFGMWARQGWAMPAQRSGATSGVASGVARWVDEDALPHAGAGIPDDRGNALE